MLGIILAGDIMSLVFTTLSREVKQFRALQDSYEAQLSGLPKGSLRIRERNGKSYYYLSYRNGQKVITDYVGNDEDKVNKIKEQLQKRKHIEEILKKLNDEMNCIKKALEEVR